MANNEMKLTPSNKMMYLAIKAYLKANMDIDSFIQDLKDIYSKTQFYTFREKALDLYKIIKTE